MFIWLLTYLLLALGLLGCFVNKVPGPLLAFFGVLIMALFGPVSIEFWKVIVIGALSVGTMVVTKKYLPKLGEMVHPFGKGGSWGTTLGSIIGLVVVIGSNVYSKAGIVLMLVFALSVFPYAFAFAFEYFSRKNVAEAARASAGAFLTFLASTVLKLLIFYWCCDILFDISFINQVNKI